MTEGRCTRSAREGNDNNETHHEHVMTGKHEDDKIHKHIQAGMTKNCIVFASQNDCDVNDGYD